MSLIRTVLSQKTCRYDRVTSVQDKSRYKARYPLVQKHWIGGRCCSSSSTLRYMPVVVVEERPCMARMCITCNDFFCDTHSRLFIIFSIHSFVSFECSQAQGFFYTNVGVVICHHFIDPLAYLHSQYKASKRKKDPRERLLVVIDAWSIHPISRLQ